MKSFLIICLCLVAAAQAAETPTSSDPCHPSNLPKVDPKTCCPGYPDFKKAPFMKTCATECTPKDAKPNNNTVCCISKCFVTQNKGYNADGSINADNLVSSILSYSSATDKAAYKTFAAKVVKQCVAGEFLILN
jgi:hypothetical protein